MDYLKTWRRRSRCNCSRKDCLILIVVRRGFTSQSTYAVLTSATGEHTSAKSCNCNAGGACHCFTPRKSAPRRLKPGNRSPDEDHDNQTRLAENKAPEQSSPLSSQVLARIAELRPVLPRPSNRSVYLAGPSHDPSSNMAHSHTTRHYTRDNMMFSPYGRAYEMSHGLDTTGHNNMPEQNQVQEILQDVAGTHGSTIPSNQQTLDIPSSVESWLSTGESFPSTCNCGDGCTCPGCIEHNGNRAGVPGVSAFSMCANPGACSHCLDCTILSLPASVPPDTAMSIYDSSQSQAIDDWIRQISSQSTSALDNTSPTLPTDLTMTQAYSSPQWDNVQLQRAPESACNSPSSECCIGRCKCPSGFCTCPTDCCGCCQGCDCAEHEHHGDVAARTGGLTFATSGERGSCCSGARRRAQRSLESFERGRMDLPLVGPPSRHLPSSNRGLLDIPDLSRSRSSSASSQSVPEPGYATHLSTMFPPRPILSRKLPSSGASSTAQLRVVNSSNVSPQLRSPRGSRINPNIGITHAPSNPDSEVSDDQGYSPYDPSLDGMHLY
jgi:hypothetical protein